MPVGKGTICSGRFVKKSSIAYRARDRFEAVIIIQDQPAGHHIGYKSSSAIPQYIAQSGSPRLGAKRFRFGLDRYSVRSLQPLRCRRRGYEERVLPPVGGRRAVVRGSEIQGFVPMQTAPETEGRNLCVDRTRPTHRYANSSRSRDEPAGRSAVSASAESSGTCTVFVIGTADGVGFAVHHDPPAIEEKRAVGDANQLIDAATDDEDGLAAPPEIADAVEGFELETGIPHRQCLVDHQDVRIDAGRHTLTARRACMSLE